MSKPAKLRLKARAEMFAVRRVERAVAKTVVGPLERDDAALAGGQHGCF